MVHTKTFLCCFSLESGGIFIGWLGIIYNSFLLIVGSLSNYIYKKMEEDSIENQNRKLLEALSEGSYGGYGGYSGYGRRGYRNVRSISDDNFIEKAIFIAKLHVLILTILCYVMIILRLIASIVLLIGTKKRNHQFVFGYVIFEGINRILSMITSLVLFPYFPFDIFWIYVLISTFSLYTKLEKESRRGTSIELTSVNTALNPLMGQNYPQIQYKNGAYGQPQQSAY